MLQRILLLTVACLFAGVSVHAQSDKPLTNTDIVQMVKAGFQDPLIIKAIEASDTAFDMSVQALLALKQEGVSEQVIARMIDRQPKKVEPNTTSNPRAEQAENPVATLQVGADTNGKSSGSWPAEFTSLQRENGIYYKQDGQFVTLFGKPIVRTQTAGRTKAVWTMGIAKVRTRAELVGKYAQLQLVERQPTFYVVVPEGQSPEALTLLKLDQEGDRRRFQVGSGGGIAARSASGYDLDRVCQTMIERIAPRLYSVVPAEELKQGEYGFIGMVTYATVGVAGAGVLAYDFGIQRRR